MTNKRRREPAAVDTQLVEIYEDLANIDDEIRLKAAQALLLRVAPEAKPTVQQVNEVLRRLFRGLCSGRKAARLGFSIVLTEFLTQLFDPTSTSVSGIQSIPELIEMLKAQTHTRGNVSGEVCNSYVYKSVCTTNSRAVTQEERDHQLGRLFGAEALIKSGILFESSVALEPWSQILDVLFELATKKSNLREECGWILYGAAQDLCLKVGGAKLAQLIVDKLLENNLTKTPEGVAIWIKIQSNIPNVILPAGVWHHDDPLDKKEKARIVKILKEASTSDLHQVDSGSKISQKGHWTSKLHFVWDVVISQLLVPQQIKDAGISKRQSFVGFWEECVDSEWPSMAIAKFLLNQTR